MFLKFNDTIVDTISYNGFYTRYNDESACYEFCTVSKESAKVIVLVRTSVADVLHDTADKTFKALQSNSDFVTVI